MWNSLFYSILLSLLLVACNEPAGKVGKGQAATKVQEEKCGSSKSRGVVYKGSELALAMRSMHDHLEEAGKLLKKGEQVPDSLLPDFDHILTDKPTNPDEIGPKFYTFAQGWLGVYEDFRNDRNTESYNKVMNTCINCHEQFCPGPIPKIKKLKLVAHQ